jgi:hypothetical protein
MQVSVCLTHHDHKTYDEFIARARTHAITSKAKLAALEDNMDVQRLCTLTEKDIDRLSKYYRAWLALRQVEDIVSYAIGGRRVCHVVFCS